MSLRFRPLRGESRLRQNQRQNPRAMHTRLIRILSPRNPAWRAASNRRGGALRLCQWLLVVAALNQTIRAQGPIPTPIPNGRTIELVTVASGFAAPNLFLPTPDATG